MTYTIADAVKQGTENSPVLADRLRRASRILHLAPPWKVQPTDARLWYVPSESRSTVRYLVDVDARSCTCPDYRQAIVTAGRRGAPSRWCKHRLAVAILARVQRKNGDTPPPNPSRSTAPTVTKTSQESRPDWEDVKATLAEAAATATPTPPTVRQCQESRGLRVCHPKRCLNWQGPGCHHEGHDRLPPVLIEDAAACALPIPPGLEDYVAPPDVRILPNSRIMSSARIAEEVPAA